MRPSFTPDEQYLLSTLRSSVAARSGNALAWGYLRGVAVLVSVSVFFGLIELAYIGCLLLFGFRLYEMYYERQWTPIWPSVIDKYEDAISASTEPNANHAP
jgi:hypothetical protein